MRLKKIKIINFGQLSNLTFDLPSNKINVFFGENEAGKSTTVAFIKQVMFGFYLRSNSSTFFEDYKPLAQVSPMGGSLFFEDQDGSCYELERLWAKGDKTKRGILTVKKDDQVVPESLFFDQIHNIDGDFYADSFIFNQDTLRQVSSLSENELLERIYYLGASNSGKLLELRDKFEKEAGKLFKKTGRKPEINRLLTEYQEQRNELTHAESEFEEYRNLESQLQNKQKQLSEMQSDLTDLETQKQKLITLKQQLENYQKLQKLKQASQDVQFNQDDYQKAQDFVAKINNLQKSIETTQSQIDHLTVDSNFDAKRAKEFIRKRSEILQWQSQEQVDKQKIEEVELEKRQIIQINPDLGSVLQMNQQQFDQMCHEYEELPKEKNFESTPVNGSNSWNNYGIGGILILIGMIGIVFGQFLPISISLLTVGAILIGFSSFKNNQDKQKRSESLLNDQKEIKEARNNFQNKYQLDPNQLNISNLQNAWGQYQLKESTQKINQLRLVKLNQSIETFANELANSLKEPVDSNINDILNILNNLEVQFDSYRHQTDIKNSLQRDLEAKESRLKELKLELKTILAKNNLEKIEDFNQLYQKYLHQAELKAQISALISTIKDDLPQLEKINQDNSFTEKEKHLNEKIQMEDKLLNEERAKIATIEVKMQNLTDSNKLLIAKQEHANTEAQIEKTSDEYLADLFAARIITRMLDITSNERFPKMIKAAKYYFKSLTGGRYRDILLDKKISVVRSDGKKLEIKYLSRATAEQLYFALKLAFVGQINDKINLPVLIDDSFVNFDENRISYIKHLLDELSSKNQVLIFTAQRQLADRLTTTPLTYVKGQNNA